MRKVWCTLILFFAWPMALMANGDSLSFMNVHCLLGAILG